MRLSGGRSGFRDAVAIKIEQANDLDMTPEMVKQIMTPETIEELYTFFAGSRGCPGVRPYKIIVEPNRDHQPCAFCGTALKAFVGLFFRFYYHHNPALNRKGIHVCSANQAACEFQKAVRSAR